jgi:GTPase involved in cell partitioning and DNA repair
MTDVEWKPLPTPMWPEGSVTADVPGLILEASFDQGVPTWKVHRHTGKNALPLWSQAAQPTASRPPRQRRCT